MFTSSDEVLNFIKKEGVEFVDVRFTDLPGQQQHFNVPAADLPDDFFADGVMFDGSSIRGFAAIHKSDMNSNTSQFMKKRTCSRARFRQRTRWKDS